MLRGCRDHGQQGNAKGYANVAVDGRSERLHRVVYCAHKGCTLASIRGQVVRHKCDNPRCINPRHLLLGTQADNMKDKADRGRAVRHSQRLFSIAEVRSIRRTYRPGVGGFYSAGSAKALAKKHQVQRSTIMKIINRETYKEYP